MEDLLVLILQFIFEVLLEVLAELPWDLFIGSREPSVPHEAGPGLWIFLSLAAGAGIGGLSLLFFPTTLLHWGGARMANLLAAPAISALVSIGFSRRTSGTQTHNVRAFCAASFTFALAVIRFTFASRPQ